MNKQEKQTGTTLEVLAPYLPYGIELFGPFPASEYPGASRVMEGLSKNEHGGIVQTISPVGAWESTYVMGLLPILRPFSALCDPLPDGTVPAVEVAKLVLGNVHFAADEKPVLQRADHTLLVRFGSLKAPIVVIGDTSAMAWVDSEGNMNAPVKYLAAIAYLRSQHFAVGLEPSQFIAK